MDPDPDLDINKNSVRIDFPSNRDPKIAGILVRIRIEASTMIGFWIMRGIDIDPDPQHWL